MLLFSAKMPLGYSWTKQMNEFNNQRIKKRINDEQRAKNTAFSPCLSG